MRRVRLLLSALLCPLCFFAQIRWDGEAANGRWDDPLNWVGDQVPGPADEVILDHQVVVGNYIVRLPDGDQGVTVSRLIIAPQLPDSITFLVPSSNVAAQAFHATASGDAVIIRAGSNFINASGAASGTPVSVSGESHFRVENGGRYVHRTERGHTTGLVSRLAMGPGTESGIFEFDVPSAAAYTVSVSNRTYGHLIFSASAAGGVKTYTGAGISPLEVASDLEIRQGALFSYGNNVSTIYIRGSCRIDTGAGYNIANGANSSLIHIEGDLHNHGRIIQTGPASGSVLRLGGEWQQHVYGTGAWQGAIRLEIDNFAHVVLHDTVDLSGDLDLKSGKLIVEPAALLRMREQSAVLNSSANSFIEGRMSRIGGTAFLFPLGRGEIYAPLQIAAGGNPSDTFYAGYFRESPLILPGVAAPLRDPIRHLSSVEYWELSGTGTLAPRVVSLFAGYTSFVQEPASILVAARENGEWVSKGQAGFDLSGEQAPWVSGFFHAAEPSDQFGYFTLASSEPGSINPLPVRLESFTATLANGPLVHCRWTMSEQVPPGTRFMLSLSGVNGSLVNWDTLLTSRSGTRYFETVMQLPGQGIYRLQLHVEQSGQAPFLSGIRQVLWQASGMPAVLYPNPASDRLFIRWHSGPMPFDIRIINNMGQVVMSQRFQGVAQYYHYPVSISQLSPGSYWLEISRGNIYIDRIRFLKR